MVILLSHAVVAFVDKVSMGAETAAASCRGVMLYNAQLTSASVVCTLFMPPVRICYFQAIWCRDEREKREKRDAPE